MISGLWTSAHHILGLNVIDRRVSLSKNKLKLNTLPYLHAFTEKYQTLLQELKALLLKRTQDISEETTACYFTLQTDTGTHSGDRSQYEYLLIPMHTGIYLPTPNG